MTDGDESSFGSIGIEGREVFGVEYKGVTGVVSPIPFKTIEANLPTILAHQKVVEACMAKATTLPVRFGVIFKNENGVKEMLSKSYDDYRTKLVKLNGKDEFGAKVILDEAGLKRVKTEVESESAELGKLRKTVSKAAKGTSYLLSIKMEEAVRNAAAKKVEEMSMGVHAELSRAAVDSAVLKSEHQQIVLNAAYLVDRSRREEFQAESARVRRKYEKEGLTIHLSGPWAPYSFC